jgi:hypothetical protein
VTESPSSPTGAPAPTGPEGAPAESHPEVALGPDPSIYPEALRPRPTEPPAPPVQGAPEPAESSAAEAVENIAGAAESPQEGETRGARRRAAEEAYQRGLADARAERAQEEARQVAQRTQREATEHVERLFSDLESADYATQDRARQGILQMYRGNRQAQALMTTTRQQILSEMAADFLKLRELPNVSEEDYQSLHSAPTAAELAKRAMDLGRKSRDDQIARLEAELEGLRGRLVGSRATPEPRNGGGGDVGSLSIEQYLTLSPKDAAKLSSAQIDAITAQFLADQQRNGR